MFKIVRWLILTASVFVLFILGVLIADKFYLRNEVIRLHVIANSDTEEDQNVKLVVRDAILNYIDKEMNEIKDIGEAQEYIENHLCELETIANQALGSIGNKQKAHLSLGMEKFGKRCYNSFSLPSGVYKSLRVDIGAAEGKNWWCVVFPALCNTSNAADFQDLAVASGFETGLADTISNKNSLNIRFFLLDCIGRIENIFHFKE